MTTRPFYACITIDSYVIMNYIQSEMLHSHPAPNALESVTYQPDILSVVISWEASVKERGYITMVTVRYYNSEGVEMGNANVKNGERTYRYITKKYIHTHGIGILITVARRPFLCNTQ